MSDVRLTDEYYHFLYDPSLFGFESAYFQTNSGTPAVSGNKIRLNAATVTSYPEYVYGDIEMLLTIPAAPTAGDSRIFGFKAAALSSSNYAYFNISGTTLTAVSRGLWGSSEETTTITWNSAWTAAATRFEIRIETQGTRFLIDGVEKAFHATSAPKDAALPLYFSNVNSDNADISWFIIKAFKVVGDTTTEFNIDEIVVNTQGPTTLTGGSKTVATAGTGEALGATLTTKQIYIRAKSTNTGNVYVGDSSVDKTSNKQVVLAANDSVTISISNRSTVYVDVDTNGEGVDYLCLS